jgi:hypothetical protein
MAERKATLERLNAFSDGVFSIIITILVLELNPPEHPTFAALLALWPTGVSYVVSYLFVAIVWVNHHHVLQYAEAPNRPADSAEFRASVFGFARSVLDRLDGSYSIGWSTSRIASRSIRPRKCHVCGAVVGDVRTNR